MDKRAGGRENGCMTVCKHVTYSGRVQGVGFRYTVQNLAQDYAVNGFVRNLPNGSVEVLAEGEPGQVEEFLSAIDRRMAGYIEQKSKLDEASCGYNGFRIRY
jgi:acylphosphatase